MNLLTPERVCHQPYGSNLCGPACVGSILDLTLEEAIQLIGKRGLTRTKQVREALAKRGVTLGDRCLPRHEEKGQLYLAVVRWPKNRNDERKTPRTHWVLIDFDGAIYDPAWGIHADLGIWPEGSRITSIYPIEWDTNIERRVEALNARSGLDAPAIWFDTLGILHYTCPHCLSDCQGQTGSVNPGLKRARCTRCGAEWEKGDPYGPLERK